MKANDRNVMYYLSHIKILSAWTCEKGVLDKFFSYLETKLIFVLKTLCLCRHRLP